MPRSLAERSLRFNTPHRAIAISVLVPVLVIIGSRGKTDLLGELYAFGLLGAFTLTSVGLDRIRWQERARNVGFFLGLVTSLLIVTSWGVNLVHKKLATIFGGSVTVIGLALAYSVRRGWIGTPRSGF